MVKTHKETYFGPLDLFIDGPSINTKVPIDNDIVLKRGETYIEMPALDGKLHIILPDDEHISRDPNAEIGVWQGTPYARTLGGKNPLAVNGKDISSTVVLPGDTLKLASYTLTPQRSSEIIDDGSFELTMKPKDLTDFYRLLSDPQKSFLEEIYGKVTEAELKQFMQGYSDAVDRSLKVLLAQQRNWIAGQKDMLDATREMARFNHRIEDYLFPQTDKISPEHYDIIKNPKNLLQSTILPSKRAQLDDEETWDSRELLTVNKLNNRLAYALYASRSLAQHDPDESFNSYYMLLDAYKTFSLFVSDATNINGASNDERGVEVTFSDKMLNDAVCRHKAAMFQLMLQETPLRSRYVRGRTLGSENRHAVLEVDIDFNGTYDLVVDPNKKIIGRKTPLEKTGFTHIRYDKEKEFGFVTYGNDVPILIEMQSDSQLHDLNLAEPQPQDIMFVPKNEFNKVWRPKKREIAEELVFDF